MNPAGGNNPCGTKEEDRDASGRGKIIPVEQKSKIEMHSAGRNNPCGRKEQDRDESDRRKSSLWKKRASWGCIRAAEIIPVEQKRKAGMNPTGGNNPCEAKEEDRDASGRGKIIPVEEKS